MTREQTNEQRPAIEVVNFRAYKAENGPLRGFATVRVGNTVIKDVQLLEREKNGVPDYSVSMPSVKGKNKEGKDEWYPLVWFDLGSKEANRRCYEDITKAILTVYPG